MNTPTSTSLRSPVTYIPERILGLGFYTDLAKTAIRDALMKFKYRSVCGIGDDIIKYERSRNIDGFTLFFKASTGEVSIDFSNGYYWLAQAKTKAMRAIALQIKFNTVRTYSENVWSRTNFQKIELSDGQTITFAELYFIYDRLLGNQRSVRVFMRENKERAENLIGQPHNPILSEVQKELNEKKCELFKRHKLNIDRFSFNDDCRWTDRNADKRPLEKEFRERMLAMMAEYEARSKQMIADEKLRFNKELAELENMGV